MTSLIIITHCNNLIHTTFWMKHGTKNKKTYPTRWRNYGVLCTCIAASVRKSTIISQVDYLPYISQCRSFRQILRGWKRAGLGKVLLIWPCLNLTFKSQPIILALHISGWHFFTAQRHDCRLGLYLGEIFCSPDTWLKVRSSFMLFRDAVKEHLQPKYNYNDGN